MMTSSILACSNERISVLSWDESSQYCKQVVLAVMGASNPNATFREIGCNGEGWEVRWKYIIMGRVLIQIELHESNFP